MAETTARIMTSLKRIMKSREITYAELGRRIQLSEASIKRIFSHATLSLERLDEICGALEVSIQEVVRLAGEQATDAPELLTLEQESALAADPRLYLLCARGSSRCSRASDARKYRLPADKRPRATSTSIPEA
jgi:DNA-binding Xre family transcriptional regulator